MNTYIMVIVTAVNEQEAEKIAQHLLQKRLIACANITGPVSSLFRWDDKLEKAKEYLVFMKTRRDLFRELTETVEKLHSYEIPEIIALPITEGSGAYLAWLDVCLVGAKKG